MSIFFLYPFFSSVRIKKKISPVDSLKKLMYSVAIVSVDTMQEIKKNLVFLSPEQIFSLSPFFFVHFLGWCTPS